MNGKNCAFDTKSSTCVEAGDCNKFHSDSTACGAEPGCAYFSNWRKPKTGMCLSVREPKGNACGSIFEKDKCELDGYAKEKCVHVNICRPYGNFDARGFDNGGFHLNGTRYDDQGFDWNGYYTGTFDRYDNLGYDINGRNRAGFDRNGLDINGFNELGLDGNGFNQRGFAVDGRFRDGNLVDADGRDVFGFNVNGLDNAGRDINGYDVQGIGSDNLYITGHAELGIGENFHLGNQFISFLDGRPDEAIAFSNRGMDQLGRFKALPHGPAMVPGVDERYNWKGVNLADRNYLGLREVDFAAHGYDAILNVPEVANNLGLYPDDLDQLITNFKNKCYELKFNDPITMGWEKLEAASFAQGVPGDLNSIPFVSAYRQGYSYAETSSDSLITRVIKHGNGADDVRPLNVITDSFKRYLKKGIYFCDKFLYAGDLKDGMGKPIPKNFNALKVARKSGIYRDQLPQPNYESYLAAYQRRHGAVDFIARVREILGKQEILDGATYTEDADRNNRGYIHGHGLPEGVLIGDINSLLNVYDNGGTGKNFHESRVYLHILAMRLPSASLDEKKVIAGSFAHGGLHCHDAKRDAVAQAVRLLAPDDVRLLDEWGLKILPSDNLQIAAKKKLYVLKKNRYEDWIRSTLTARHAHEQLSPLASIWNRYRNMVGLPELENAHNFGNTMIMKRFFEKERDVNIVNYPNYLPNGLNNETLNGGFNKEEIFITLAPSMTGDDADPFKRIMKEVFGPLWELRELGMPVLGKGGRNAVDHPITKALFLRLGILKD